MELHGMSREKIMEGKELAFKYVLFDNCVVVGRTEDQHYDLAMSIGMEPVSAGMFMIYSGLLMQVQTGSSTLKMPFNPDDSEILCKALGVESFA